MKKDENFLKQFLKNRARARARARNQFFIHDVYSNYLSLHPFAALVNSRILFAKKGKKAYFSCSLSIVEGMLVWNLLKCIGLAQIWKRQEKWLRLLALKNKPHVCKSILL